MDTLKSVTKKVNGYIERAHQTVTVTLEVKATVALTLELPPGQRIPADDFKRLLFDELARSAKAQGERIVESIDIKTIRES